MKAQKIILHIQHVSSQGAEEDPHVIAKILFVNATQSDSK